MFRIRRVLDDVLPLDRGEISQVQAILSIQFPAIRPAEVAEIPLRLRNPLKYRFRALLFVADNLRGEVRGFALAHHEPDLGFVYLDYIASAKKLTGGGVGGALYQRLRDEAHTLGARGILFECAPDIREECESDDEFRGNVARLRFYERFGARPIAGTDYRASVQEGDRGMPDLVLDTLGSQRLLRRDEARKMVRAILERKYGYLCPPEYVEKVVRSFCDDPVVLRPPRYVSGAAPEPGPVRPADTQILLVVNDKHDIHHVKERGYVEAPVRVRAILKELEPTGIFRRIEPRSYGMRHITAVHAERLVAYLERCCAGVPEGESVYPYVFPIRNATRPPRELSVRAGYYCIDTFTPLNRNAFPAARRAVDCALTAAEGLVRGERITYALVRPPGHHAEREVFGGFCYFNSAAIAAHFLSGHGRVAVLDLDYHHGNGQQDIFYERADVLTLSIHGHPRFAYPYFSGFEDERGAGPGEGYNRNYPLPETVDGERYRETLRQAVVRIQRFAPTFLVIALGLDTVKGDPTGSWALTARDLGQNARLIGALRLPTLVVQEGGYRTRTLGVNARHFFQGLTDAVFGIPDPDLAKRGNKRSGPHG